MTLKYIFKLISQLQIHQPLNAFDESFLLAMHDLIIRLPKKQAKPLRNAFDKNFIEALLKARDERLINPSVPSDPSQSSLPIDRATCQIRFVTTKVVSLFSIDWLHILAQRWRAIVDEPTLDYTFTAENMSNQAWYQFLFTYILNKHEGLSYLHALIPDAINKHDPVLLRKLDECLECKLELRSTFPEASDANLFFFYEPENTFYHVKEGQEPKLITIVSEQLSSFKQELYKLMSGKRTMTLTVPRLNALIAAHGGDVVVDLRQYYLNKSNLNLVSLLGHIFRFNTHNLFASYENYNSINLTPILPIELFRIRNKIHAPKVYFDGKEYNNFWTFLKDVFLPSWQKVHNYSIELCEQLPTEAIDDLTIYLVEIKDGFSYLVHTKTVGTLNFDEFTTKFTTPVTFEQLNDAHWEVEMLLKAKGHAHLIADFPKQLFPSLLHMIDNYFLMSAHNVSQARATLKDQMTLWSSQLDNWVIRDINYFYAQPIYLGDGDSLESVYVIDILADCYDDHASHFDEKLIAVAEFLTDFDAEYSRIATCEPLKNLYSKLSIGPSFSVNKLKRILKESLYRDASIQIREKIDAFILFLNTHKQIDERALYFLSEIYELRRKDRPYAYQYEDRESQDYCWVRLAQQLAGAKLLNCSYHELLIPNIRTFSLAELRKVRSKLPQKQLYFKLFGETYENFSHYLDRPMVLHWHTQASIPRYVLDDILDLVDGFFESQITHRIDSLMVKLRFLNQLLKDSSSIDVDYLYSQSVDVDGADVFLAEILVDLYEWVVEVKYKLKLHELGQAPIPTDLVVADELLFKKVKSLSRWLFLYDASLIGSQQALIDLYHSHHVGPGFTVDDLISRLSLLMEHCSTINRTNIEALIETLKHQPLITVEVMFSLCSIYKQNSDEVINTPFDYTLAADGNPWVELARCLEGAKYFRPYSISISKREVIDVAENKIVFHLKDNILYYSLRTPHGQLVTEALPPSVVSYPFAENLTSTSQLDEIMSSILYYISSLGQMLPQNYYSLLFWPLNQQIDTVRRMPIIQFDLGDFTRSDSGHELILLLNCVAQFKAERTFGYCNTSSTPLSLTELERVSITKYGPYVKQAQFLAQQGNPLPFHVLLAIYNLVNDALYTKGLVSDKEYSMSEFKCAQDAYLRFFSFYKKLSPEIRERLNAQRVVFFGKNKTFADILDRRHSDKFCMAVTGSQVALVPIAYGPFRYRNDIESYEIFTRLRERVEQNSIISDPETILNRMYSLFVDILTRKFHASGTRQLNSINFGDINNKISTLANAILTHLNRAVHFEVNVSEYVDLYIHKILSEIVVPSYYTNRHLLSIDELKWLRSIMDDTLYKARYFYDAASMFLALKPYVASNSGEAILIRGFLEDVLQSMAQTEQPLNKKLRANIKLVSLLRQPALRAEIDFINSHDVPTPSSLEKRQRSAYIFVNGCDFIYEQPSSSELRARARSAFILVNNALSYYNKVEETLIPVPLMQFEIERIKLLLDPKCKRFLPLSAEEYSQLSQIIGQIYKPSLYYYDRNQRSITQLQTTETQIEEIKDVCASIENDTQIPEYELKRISLILDHTPCLIQRLWKSLERHKQARHTESYFYRQVANFLLSQLNMIGAKCTHDREGLFSTEPVDTLDAEFRIQIEQADSVYKVIYILKSMVQSVPKHLINNEKVNYLDKIAQPLTVVNPRVGIGRHLTF